MEHQCVKQSVELLSSRDSKQTISLYFHQAVHRILNMNIVSHVHLFKQHDKFKFNFLQTFSTHFTNPHSSKVWGKNILFLSEEQVQEQETQFINPQSKGQLTPLPEYGGQQVTIQSHCRAKMLHVKYDETKVVILNTAFFCQNLTLDLKMRWHQDQLIEEQHAG